MIKPIETLSPLGRTLRNFRKENRYSLENLADMAGLSKSYVWELETNHRSDPALSTLVSLAKAMKKPVGWLANRASMLAAVKDEGNGNG